MRPALPAKAIVKTPDFGNGRQDSLRNTAGRDGSMTDDIDPRSGGRLSFLDGLRGLAALQVVFLHYCAAFLPGMGTQNLTLSRYGWERIWLKAPLYMLIDGTFAVYLFFAISGMALTVAYRRRPAPLATTVLQRLVRLGGPLAAALALGALLLAAWPQAHVAAAAISGSGPWLGTLMHARTSLGEVLRQAASSGMVVGYRETSLFAPSVLARLQPMSVAQSLDPPLWTLHVEFWGSLLVAVLALARRRLTGRWYCALVAALTLLLLRHAFLAFMVGHLFALLGESRRWSAARSSRAGTLIGSCAIVVGVLGCTNPPWAWLATWLALPGPLRWYGPEHLQNLYAAVLVFAGVMSLPGLWRVLERRPVQWLGHVSFGLYLTHFPVLFTIVSALFVALHGHMRYGEALCVAAAVGIPLSLLVAWLFTSFVDLPFVSLGRRIRGFGIAAGQRAGRTMPDLQRH